MIPPREFVWSRFSSTNNSRSLISLTTAAVSITRRWRTTTTTATSWNLNFAAESVRVVRGRPWIAAVSLENNGEAVWGGSLGVDRSTSAVFCNSVFIGLAVKSDTKIIPVAGRLVLQIEHVAYNIHGGSTGRAHANWGAHVIWVLIWVIWRLNDNGLASFGEGVVHVAVVGRLATFSGEEAMLSTGNHYNTMAVSNGGALDKVNFIVVVEAKWHLNFWDGDWAVVEKWRQIWRSIIFSLRNSNEVIFFYENILEIKIDKKFFKMLPLSTMLGASGYPGSIRWKHVPLLHKVGTTMCFLPFLLFRKDMRYVLISNKTILPTALDSRGFSEGVWISWLFYRRPLLDNNRMQDFLFSLCQNHCQFF